MVDIAAGMEFCEKNDVVHMDLAARNCLIGDDNLLKVADFGLAVKLDPGDEYYIVSANCRIPVKWCSPEAITNRHFSCKSDVWAAGVTFWEIFRYGSMPYADIPVTQIARKLQEGTRLVLPRKIPANIQHLVQSCWTMGKLDRPTFAELRSELATVFMTTTKTHAPRDICRTLHNKEDVAPEQRIRRVSATTSTGSGYEYGAAQPVAGDNYEYGGAQEINTPSVVEEDAYEYGGPQEITSASAPANSGVNDEAFEAVAAGFGVDGGEEPVVGVASATSHMYEGGMVDDVTVKENNAENIYMEYQRPDGDTCSFMHEHTDTRVGRQNSLANSLMDAMGDMEEGEDC